MRTPSYLCLAFVIASSVAAQTAPPIGGPRPTLVISGGTIAVDGLTPRGPVLFFAVQHVPVRYGTAFRRIERIVTDTNVAGHAELTKVPALTAAIWAAVDLTTGRAVVSTPQAFALRTFAPPSGGLKRSTDGLLSRFTVGRSRIEGVLIRPGKGGAWSFTVGDGSASDADGEVNGRVEFQFDRMLPIGDSGPPPSRLLPSDTLIVIDPSSMEIAVIEVPL